MKLSKTLLKTIAVGIAMGTLSSCSLFEDSSEIHLKTCEESCDIDHAIENKPHDNCPACGLG